MTTVSVHVGVDAAPRRPVAGPGELAARGAKGGPAKGADGAAKGPGELAREARRHGCGAKKGRVERHRRAPYAETVGQMFPFVMTNGDTGISEVTSFQCSISSGTAGDIGITLMRRIAEIPISSANVGALVNAYDLGLPQILDDACLAAMVQCSTTSTGFLQGAWYFLQG